MKRILGVVGAALALAVPSVVVGQVLDFEGIVPGNVGYVTIGDWYNGGGGPNYGISFSDNAYALCQVTAYQDACDGSSNISRGGQGDVSSRLGGMIFLGDAPSTYMNGTSGFTSGFSFFYSAPVSPGGFTVWSGLNGTGIPLATLVLPLTSNGGSDASCFFQVYCPFYATGVNFAGTAYSVTFEGVANYIAFDDVTFGSSTPGNVVPEPATIGLVGTGLVGLFGARFRRRKSA